MKGEFPEYEDSLEWNKETGQEGDVVCDLNFYFKKHALFIAFCTKWHGFAWWKNLETGTRYWELGFVTLSYVTDELLLP